MNVSFRAHFLLWGLLLAPGLAAAQDPSPPPSVASRDTILVTLEEMVQAALQNNIGLRIQRLDRTLAEADFLSARGAFDPTWALALSRSATGTTVVGDSADTEVDQSNSLLQASFGGLLPVSTGYSLGLKASRAYADPINSSVGPFRENYTTGAFFSLHQPLLRGFGLQATTAQRESARQALRAAEEQVKRDMEEAIARVERAFWLLQLTEDAEAIARASLQRARDLYRRNSALRERDLISELDLITSQRALSLRETSYVSARRQRMDAAEGLVFLVYGEEAHRELVLGGATIRAAPSEPAHPRATRLEALEDAALRSRNDVAAARQSLAGAESSLDYARNRLKPELDLSFDVDYGGLSDDLRFFSYPHPQNTRSTVYSIGASFSLPQFNLSARARAQSASSRMEQARLSVALVENRIRREVRAAIRGVSATSESLVHSDSLQALALTEYEIARSGVDLGQITVFQLFQYEDELVTARLTRAQDRYQYALATTEYYLAAGTIADRYGIDLTPASR